MRDLTRRQFGILSGVATAGAASALVLPRRLRADTPSEDSEEFDMSQLHYAPGDATPVAVATVPRDAADEATERAVREVAQAATDFSWLSPGDTVLIKPVVNSGNVYPMTTDPIALRAMIGLLREKGAGRVLVGDMSGVQFVRFHKDSLSGSSRKLMESSGVARAATDAGAELHAFEEAGWDGFFDAAPKAAGYWTGPIMLPNVLKQADHVVLMPRCARHLLAGSTLGLKAAVGWWRHDSRLEYHGKAGSFSQKTADANTVPEIADKQRLVLTSATKVLTTFGPDNGWIVRPDPGLVFASTDVVAHDMVSLATLLEGRRRTPEKRKDGLLDDPNQSGTVVNFANKMVVQWLGGFGQMWNSERIARYDMDTIWDDRVLRRAFEWSGGVPRVELAAAGAALPPAVHDDLARAVALAS